MRNGGEIKQEGRGEEKVTQQERSIQVLQSTLGNNKEGPGVYKGVFGDSHASLSTNGCGKRTLGGESVGQEQRRNLKRVQFTTHCNWGRLEKRQGISSKAGTEFHLL